MIKLVDLLKEVQNQPSPKEQAIIDDILSLDEAVDFSNVMNKVKSYVKKGLITATILASLLNKYNLNLCKPNKFLLLNFINDFNSII
jgi:hypothetical protein